MARKSSIISPRNQGIVPGVPTPWQATWTPGPSLANLFDLYPSRGDVTIAEPTSFPALLDGPIHIYRFNTLTVNAALVPPNVRCRGAFVLADNLVMGAAGSISMTARGAAGCSKWINQDIGIPASIALSGKATSQRAYLEWLAEHGYFIGDPTLYACPLPGMGDVLADYADWPARMAAIVVSAAGCGAAAETFGAGPGAPGKAGNNAPGSGGCGGTALESAASGAAKVWGGGAASGGKWSQAAGPKMLVDQYGGQGGYGDGPGSSSNAGGGAGNPGGKGSVATPGTGLGENGTDGTGGLLVVLVRYNVMLTAGHVFSSNGSRGGNADSGGTVNHGLGGGGSGAGRVALYYGGTLTGTPNLVAIGGLAGTGTNYNGGQGGVGATDVKPYSQMGWAA